MILNDIVEDATFRVSASRRGPRDEASKLRGRYPMHDIEVDLCGVVVLVLVKINRWGSRRSHSLRGNGLIFGLEAR